MKKPGNKNKKKLGKERTKKEKPAQDGGPRKTRELAQILPFPPRSPKALSKTEAPQLPADQAQELAYRAMEADDADEAIELCGQALALDPRCVDAMRILADEAAESEEEHIEDLRRAVAVGAEALGEDFFAESRGHFWGIVETRPYMRARQGLASALWDAGCRIEAVAHYEAMLELNPNDNQGIRYLLLPAYLAMGETHRAGRLLDEYPKDPSAIVCWCRVLQLFAAGDLIAAEDALATARHANPYMESYLLGERSLPETQPAHFEMGKDSEAVVAAGDMFEAWYHNPMAQLWLSERGAAAKRRSSRAGNRHAALREVDEAEVEALFPGFTHWPASWAGDKKELEFAQDLLRAMCPFIADLLAQGLGDRTLIRHMDNLWLLGGEIVRSAMQKGKKGADPARQLRDALDPEGGPPCLLLPSESAENSYHVTCRKLFRFLERERQLSF